MFFHEPLSIPTPIRSPAAFATPVSRRERISSDRSASSSCRTTPSARPPIRTHCCSIFSPARTGRRRRQAVGIGRRSSVRWVRRGGCGSFEMNEYEPDAHAVSETHRYFPEWADRPIGPEAQHEADRNSYLAGGYADEFGYGTHAGRPPAIAPLDGDPECSRLWGEQIGALHPGYPQCPKPADRLLEPPDGRVRAVGAGTDEPHKAFASRMIRAQPVARMAFRIIRVGSRDRVVSGHPALRFGVISFLAERLIRRRHLNDVL